MGQDTPYLCHVVAVDFVVAYPGSRAAAGVPDEDRGLVVRIFCAGCYGVAG